ncbi:MAG: phosphoglucosamine mutase [Clostridia bacterium]
MTRLFGTDGVRGIANLELTSDLAFRLGQAGAHVLAGKLNHAPTVIVGTDTRVSCDMLFCALAAGLCSVGANVVKVGVIPTPGIAYLTRKHGADAGVVISASHNSYEFNGIKFFDSRGYKLADEVENAIEAVITGGVPLPHKMNREIGRVLEKPEYLEDYKDFLFSQFEANLSGWEIFLDCANGAASGIAPDVFRRAGALVHAISDKPDGFNINEECGSTHPEKMSEVVRDSNARAGFAYDGDADRLIAFSGDGQPIDGDMILSALALHMKKQGRLRHNRIVTTVMSNIGLDKMAGENDIEVVRTRVGDRYVIEEMLRSGSNLGGEQSGHIILTDCNTTGDGILTSIKLISMLELEHMSPEDIREMMTVYPQITRNARVGNGNKEKFFEDMVLMDMCRELDEILKGEGRVIIRPSGTEPVIRVMMEGRDIGYITEKTDEMVRLIEERLG